MPNNWEGVCVGCVWGGVEHLAVQCYKIVFIMNNTLGHMTLCQPIELCFAVKMIESSPIILGLGYNTP